MKILVVAPHPDDEVIGCGGTIVKHAKSGNEVSLCFVTAAYTPDWSKSYIKNRKLEIQKACEVMGISSKFQLDLPTVKLDTVPQKELNDKLSKVVLEAKPDVCYIPSYSDLNKDHRLVFESSLVALRPLAHRTKKILSYEVLSETEWGSFNRTFQPNVYVDVTKTFKDKILAMKAYASELKSGNHPRSLEIIESLARKRGSEIGCKYAEAFSLIRHIE
jgi:N-acetylglucosamine malate deacetylase 1